MSYFTDEDGAQEEVGSLRLMVGAVVEPGCPEAGITSE